MVRIKLDFPRFWRVALAVGVLFLMPIVGHAQSSVQSTPGVSKNIGYCLIKYVKKHLVCRKGDEMNVIDLDLEWPEFLYGTRVDSLQNVLESKLFGTHAANWQEAMGNFISSFGTPVKGQLGDLPDDNKFCYVTCKLEELGIWKGKFATFGVSVKVEPQKGCSRKASDSNEIITFDLLKNDTLKRNQILRMTRITDNPSYSQHFSQLLLTNAFPAIDFTPTAINLADQIGIGEQQLVVPFMALDDALGQISSCMAYLPTAKLGDYLTKEFQKRISMEVLKPTLQPTDALLDDTSICKNPTSNPELPLPGKPSVSSYLMSHVVISEQAKLENAGARVLATFVVDESGSVGDVSLLRLSSPTVDRAVVKAIRLMPRLKPAMKDGKAVKVRIFQPFVLHIQ